MCSLCICMCIYIYIHIYIYIYIYVHTYITRPQEDGLVLGDPGAPGKVVIFYQ